MLNDLPEETTQADEPLAPQWLHSALSAIQAPAAFHRRCQDAASLAHSLAVMRIERESHGFLALPLADMLRALAELAAVPLEPVLRWFGAGGLDDTVPESSGPLARIASRLGFGVREVEALLRLSVARELGYASLPLLVARRQASAIECDELEACEAALGEIEARYRVHRERLHSVLQAARAACSSPETSA